MKGGKKEKKKKINRERKKTTIRERDLFLGKLSYLNYINSYS